MEVKYLSFGNLCLKLQLPERLLETEAYEPFFCEEKAADFEICYSFSKEPILLPDSEKKLERGNRIFCLDGERCSVYYKAAVPGEYYAVRRYCSGEKGANITLSEKAKGRLWARLALNTLGVEELAAQKNAVVFHSSFVEVQKKALLFTGPCGIGKSTQARLWSGYRLAPIINGDKTLLYLENEKVFASGLPFSGSSGISKNKSMELGTIVQLGKGKENRAFPLSKKQAFLCLLKSSYIPPFFSESVSATLAEIAEKSKVCSLLCTPDENAVKVLESYIEGECNT